MKDIIDAAGLDPQAFLATGHAEPINGRKGVLHGVYGLPSAGAPAACMIRYEYAGDTLRAVAMLSRNPTLVAYETTPEERERMRAETLVPSGHSEPVGQEKVLAPTPYDAPPLLEERPRTPKPEATEPMPPALPCTCGVEAAPCPRHDEGWVG